MRKNVFISGARGFVGKNLVEYFQANFSNQYALFYPYHSELDLLDTEKVCQYLKEHDIDIIIHGANVGGSRKTAYDAGKTDVVAQNLRMFFNLARCLGGDRQMIHFGSGAEYDFRHYKPRMPEEYFGVHVPEDAYGFSKYVMAKYIEQADKITNLRLFGVFGKYEDYEFKFISNAIVKNLLGMPIVINQNVNFDYLYVDDLIRMVAAFIGRRSQYRAYNAVSGRTIDLITIAQKINHLSDQSSEIVVRNPGMNVEYSADNQRIVHELGGFEYTDYDAAIASLYAWYKQKLPEIDRVGIEKDASFKYCRTKGESK